MSHGVLQRIEALVVDMDGVLWLGEQPLPGLQAFFAFLAERRLAYVLATNNASREPAYYVAKLARMGVSVTPDRILTSALATADWLCRELPRQARLFVVGEEGLTEALAARGFRIVRQALVSQRDDPATWSVPARTAEGRGRRESAGSRPHGSARLRAVDAVVVGIDVGLTYQALRDATLLVRRGARFVGTNGDLTYPSELGQVPGAGSILAAIQAATGVTPIIIGKPERHLFDAALRRLGRPLERTAVLGDRLDTDIVGAQRVGLATILVTTGVDDAASARRAGIRPDLIVSGLDELVAEWPTLPPPADAHQPMQS